MNFSSQTQLLKIFLRLLWGQGLRSQRWCGCKSEMVWLFCENRFPTDNWVFLSSVNYLEHPPSSVEWLIFGRVSSALGRRKQIQGCRMPRLLCFWSEEQLLEESASCWWHWQIWGFGGLLHGAAFLPSSHLFLMLRLTSWGGCLITKKGSSRKSLFMVIQQFVDFPPSPFQDVLWWIEAHNHWGLHFVFSYVCTLCKLLNTSPCGGQEQFSSENLDWGGACFQCLQGTSGLI